MSESVNVCRLHAAHDLRVESAPLAEPGPGVTVAVGAGGTHGADQHHFHDGGIGSIRVREPIILGHEAAAGAIGSRRIDVRPIVTGQRSLAEANAAFGEAGNRGKAVKVQLRFDGTRQV